MMSTAPPMRLTREQASRFLTYLQAYRRAALASQAPSPGRNTLLRELQTLQGKLLTLLDQQAGPVCLVVTRAEGNAVKTGLTELAAWYARQPASPARDAILVELAALKASVGRAFSRTNETAMHAASNH